MCENNECAKTDELRQVKDEFSCSELGGLSDLLAIQCCRCNETLSSLVIGATELTANESF